MIFFFPHWKTRLSGECKSTFVVSFRSCIVWKDIGKLIRHEAIGRKYVLKLKGKSGREEKKEKEFPGEA